jgi:uncharacterized protein (TIGR00645 family)
MMERAIEKLLFASRWLLAPFFLALVLALLALLLKTGQYLVVFFSHILEAREADVIVSVLKLVDLTLTGALIVIIIFSGYENFVSKIDVSAHKDWPEWMAKIDFSGLKLKLMSTIVAIAAIQLLTLFMNLAQTPDRELIWSSIILVIFVVSGLLLGLTDWLTGEVHGASPDRPDSDGVAGPRP